MENKDILAMNRRGFFRSMGAAGIAVAVGGTMAGLPGNASANIDALIAEHVGPGSITMDKIVVEGGQPRRVALGDDQVSQGHGQAASIIPLA